MLRPCIGPCFPQPMALKQCQSMCILLGCVVHPPSHASCSAFTGLDMAGSSWARYGISSTAVVSGASCSGATGVRTP